MDNVNIIELAIDDIARRVMIMQKQGLEDEVILAILLEACQNLTQQIRARKA